MARNCPRFDSITAESCRDIVSVKPMAIKPVLKSGNRSVMLERSAVPYSFERGHFVVAGSFSRLKRQIRIRSDRNGEYIVPSEMVLRYFKSDSRGKFIVRI